MNTNGESTVTPKADEALVIAETQPGAYRVFSPLNPGRQFIVTGIPGRPECTCETGRDAERPCRHISAVVGKLGNAQPPTQNGKHNGSGAVMLLKRSVSPDGRIDSLSVEFSCPVSDAPSQEIKARAKTMIDLQSEIAKGFLSKNGEEGLGHTNGSTIAHLVSMASMNGRYGKRLFLNVLVEGKLLKFFGSDKQLADAVSGAGYEEAAKRLIDGSVLNLPCRAVTIPSADGRYTNIERILPA